MLNWFSHFRAGFLSSSEATADPTRQVRGTCQLVQPHPPCRESGSPSSLNLRTEEVVDDVGVDQQPSQETAVSLIEMACALELGNAKASD